LGIVGDVHGAVFICCPRWSDLHCPGSSFCYFEINGARFVRVLDGVNIWAASDWRSVPSGSFDEAVVRGNSRNRDAVVLAKWHASLDFLDVIVPLPSVHWIVTDISSADIMMLSGSVGGRRR
jgi:hypothetical protein